MPSHLAHAPAPSIRARKAERSDLDALLDLEHRVFATDRLSRRSLRRFLSVRHRAGDRRGRRRPAGRRGGDVVPSELGGGAAVLDRGRPAPDRPRHRHACCWRRPRRRRWRATAPRSGSKCTPPITSRSRAIARAATGSSAGTSSITPTAATRCGSRSGWSGGCPDWRRRRRTFHQTTEFTCGPACIMMALAWADRNFRPSPALEFELWREASTICMGGAGPGGCEPFGLAVTLQRRGCFPEIYVSRPGPYFIDTRARSGQAARHAADTKRVST